MHRGTAAIGSIVFFVVAPGTVAGLIPWWLTSWQVDGAWLPLQVLGAIVIAAGLAVLVQAFARFVIDGFGTPAPVAPTDELVVSGLYRHVRNPMYVAVVAIIAGQALLFGQEVLFIYAASMWAVFAGFVRLYEEPTLLATYGAQYDAYRRTVPAWLPRLR
jgi:protein-S-isoprenylcysteine O-methyltransferase Ste14